MNQLGPSWLHIYLLSTIGFLAACEQPQIYSDDAYCITNVTVIDPLEGERPGQTVVIAADKILEVFSTTSKKLSSENTIIDGEGKYLMPGLWDAHVHFAYLEDLAPRMLDLFLCYGITSVRDIGGRIDFVKKWKDEAAKNPRDAPRVKIAGPLLDGLPNVYDGSGPRNPELSVGLGTVEDVEHMVDSLVALDVDLLKAYEMLTEAQFSRLTSLGRQYGLPVTGHVPLSMDVIKASNLGLSSMEHMPNLELSCASNSDELWEQRLTMLRDGRKDLGGVLRSRIHDAQRQNAVANYSDDRADEVLAVLAKNNTWQIPTLALSTASTERPFTRPDFQASFKYLSLSMENAWRDGIESFSVTEPTDFQETYTQWLLNIISKIREHDIPIMAGTDCPIFFLTPGRSLHEELAVLVKAGLSPMEAIQAATVRPAQYFKMEDELGQVRAGMMADLLLLDANPLEQIENTQKIHAVVRNGKLHTRAMLDARMEALEKNDN